MPDERDLREPEEPRESPDETPEAEGAGDASPAHALIPEPEHADDETADLIIPEDFAGLLYLDEPATSETLAREATDPTLPPSDPNALPTMPGQGSQETDSAKKTLAGTSGLDPNPDFDPRDQPAAYTVPHIVPFEHTVVHVPVAGGKEQPAPPSGQSSQPTQRPRTPTSKRMPPVTRQPKPGTDGVPQPVPGNQMTQSNATQQPPYYPPPQPPANYPPQPGGQQRGALPRRPKQRRILGCRPGCVAIIAGIFVTFCGGLTLILLILTATLGTQLEERYQAQVARVGQESNFQSTFYYDRNGNLLYEAFSEGRRTNVRFEDFPVDLINATIAIEDDSFWTNPGFEIPATVRAFLQYVGLASGGSGGSTITQQLVRNVLFDFEYRAERSVQRKVEEIILATLLTNRQSKQEILTLYLNEIYYGNLAYGAQAAAQTMFGKDVKDLTLGEAALLAGLPQAPAELDPLNPDPAVQAAVDTRWRTVLDRMVAEGLITDQQRRDTIAQGLT
ncbi:MAG: transglycosylase domain-containing protein, partial [Anaerolineae bacterium]|nr:transglycosylase domain-containing protein [Anaerolineae bacterium]